MAEYLVNTYAEGQASPASLALSHDSLLPVRVGTRMFESTTSIGKLLGVNGSLGRRVAALTYHPPFSPTNVPTNRIKTDSGGPYDGSNQVFSRGSEFLWCI